MPAQKTLFMLIRPKGSGKTRIGTIVSQYTDIVVLRLEPIWLELKPDEDGWEKVKAVIDAMFQKHDKVMIESLGVGEAFTKFHALLAEKYSIKLIRVYADLETCFARVKTRNNAVYIAVSDDKVTEFNKIAATVTYNRTLEINNNEFAVDENGITASFAGQHETYLNIIGAEAIIQAVIRCWESIWCEHALEYRRKRGLSVEHLQIAVIVQQLVASDESAIIFRANPITGNRDEIMINASWGLGESIVGGMVTPDTLSCASEI